jgi:hypothetical protein
MKEESTTTITARLRGIRPIMFDRYAGDNNTQLEVVDKGYRNAAGQYGIPTLNIFSLLTAQNTPSVAKLFYGKQARQLALGVQAFCNVLADGEDPTFAVLTDEAGEPYTAADSRMQVVKHVARVAKGIPNPKERPMLPTGWRLTFHFELYANEFLKEPTLRRMVEQGGILGLGTFRPIFGRYVVEWI